MDKFKRIGLVITMAFITAFAQAQTADTTDVMRSNGKIYVVMAVVVTILVGLFIYVTSIDRKLSRLEKKG